MPMDLRSAAEALSVSPSRNSPSSPPPWSSRRSSSNHGGTGTDGGGSTRRLSQPLTMNRNSRGSDGRFNFSRFSSSSSSTPNSFVGRMWASSNLLGEQMIKTYMRLPIWQRVVVGLGLALCWVILILSIIYSHALFEWLGPVSKTWREKPGGWLIIFFMVFFASIPPLIGYSTATTISGFVYGFPNGWPVAAIACVAGSLCAFMASRTVLSGYVDRMVGRDHRFRALGQVLRHEGLLYLTGIRFCPLPFSLSNGFLATIPSISPLAFTLATALSSPKLLVHVFIGSRLAILAERGDSMTFKDKAVNYLSMIIGAGIGIAVGLVIYRRTMARAEQIAREDALQDQEEGRGGRSRHGADFADENNDDDVEGATLMDPEDAAALMSEDDVSLWETQVDAQYRDESDGTDDGQYRDDDNAAKDKRWRGGDS